MFTLPEPAGLVTVITVLESEVIEPVVPPKLTFFALARLVPVIVTEVPPDVDPLFGNTPEAVGGLTVFPPPVLLPVFVPVVLPVFVPVLPLFGDSPVTVGATVTGTVTVYVNLSAVVPVEVPAGVVTVTYTLPVPRGLLTVSRVLESAVIVAAAPPNLTAVASARPVPKIVTLVPPPVAPRAGKTRVTDGLAVVM
jgi:hypothetical protein